MARECNGWSAGRDQRSGDGGSGKGSGEGGANAINKNTPTNKKTPTNINTNSNSIKCKQHTLHSGRYLSVLGINSKHNEFNPVFYDKALLDLDASGTFWFSDTPAIPQSKWPDSAFPRIATWGRFTHKASGQRLAFVNVHFDHESDECRARAADLLIAKLPEVTLGLPVAIVGDLNCGEGSPALAKLSAALAECSSQCCSSVLPGMLGKVGTFVGFDKSIDSQIDFVFAGQGLNPTGYGTVPDECPNGRCCSDHRPVMATLELTAEAKNVPEPQRGGGAGEQAGSSAGGDNAAAELAAAAVDKVAGKLGSFFAKLAK